MTAHTLAPLKVLMATTVLGDEYTWTVDDLEHLTIGYYMQEMQPTSLRQVAVALRAKGWVEWGAETRIPTREVEEWEEPEYDRFYTRQTLRGEHVVEITQVYDEPSRMEVE